MKFFWNPKALFSIDIIKNNKLVNSNYRYVFNTLRINLGRVGLTQDLWGKQITQPEFKDNDEYLAWSQMMMTKYKQKDFKLRVFDYGK